jgi:hypothetical protein
MGPVQEQGEQLLMAMEMLQCESSRECVLSALATGKLKCRLPPVTPLTWEEAHGLAVQQEDGTLECESAEKYEEGGYQWKLRRVPDEATFVQWVRYHCSFNAYAILGVAYDATPEQIQDAFTHHSLDLDECGLHRLCLETARELATSSEAARYQAWLAQGFVDLVHNRVPMRLPATRTNLLEALKPPGTALDRWLAS